MFFSPHAFLFKCIKIKMKTIPRFLGFISVKETLCITSCTYVFPPFWVNNSREKKNHKTGVNLEEEKKNSCQIYHTGPISTIEINGLKTILTYTQQKRVLNHRGNGT